MTERFAVVVTFFREGKSHTKFDDFDHETLNAAIQGWTRDGISFDVQRIGPVVELWLPNVDPVTRASNGYAWRKFSTGLTE